MLKELQCFPGWKLIEPPIGMGGTSVVYKCKKSDSDEYRAVKIISIPDNAADTNAYRDDGLDDESITAIYRGHVEELAREIKLLSELKDCPNIVHYLDHAIVKHDNDPGFEVYIMMEFLTPLPEYYAKKSGGEMSDEEIIKVGLDLCNALERCEANNVIHRDIKPQNIFIDNNGNFKLGDFGTAKVSDHTTRATKAGTYAYMSPEIYNGQAYNSRTDQYSLGISLYWLLNERRLPFLPLPPEVPTSEQNREAITRRMGGEQIPPPKHGSPDLKSIILKACAFSPENRFQSPGVLKQALDSVNEGTLCLLPSQRVHIIFKDDNGTVISDTEYVKGMQITVPQMNTKYGDGIICEFKGWFPVIDPIARNSSVYTAQYGNAVAIEKPYETKPIVPVIDNKPAKKNRKKVYSIISAISAAVAVICIIGAFIVFLPRNGEKDVISENLTVEDEYVVNVDDTIAEKISSDNSIEEEVQEESSFKMFSVVGMNKDDAKALLEDKGLSVTIKYEYDDSEEAGSVISQSIKKNKTVKPGEKITIYVSNGKEKINVPNVLGKTKSDAKSELEKAGFVPVINEVYSEKKSGEVINQNPKEGTLEKGSEITITVSLGSVSISSIEVKEKPSKTTYYVGESLDTSGMKLKIKYSDGSTETVYSGFTCSPSKLESKGTQKITVTYSGLNGSFSVEVKELELSKISVHTMPSKSTYRVGESFDSSGLSILATYSDGTQKIISSGFTCSPNKLSSSGTQSITVSYNGKTTSFTVTVKDYELKSISVYTLPTKTTYTVGESLDTSGLTLLATYSDGIQKLMTSGFTCSLSKLSSVGTQSITVSYNGKTTSFTVTVKEATLTSLVVRTQPNKTTYIVGESLDTSGLTLLATYSDGTQKIISSGFTCSPVLFSTAGTQFVTVVYNNISVSYLVSVEDVYFKITWTCTGDSYTGHTCTLSISTNIPNFNKNLIGWYCEDEVSIVDGSLICKGLVTDQYRDLDVKSVITASYYYNGITYTDKVYLNYEWLFY